MKTSIIQKKACFLLSVAMITCLPFCIFGQPSSSIWEENNNVQQPVDNNPIWGNQPSSSGSINADADGIATPPEDPIDAPIDGGVIILLMIGIGIGYRNSQKKKVKLDSHLTVIIEKFKPNVA